MTRKFDGDALIIATHNAGKMMEFAALLSPFGIKVTSAADHHLDEPEETEDSFVGNARIKARAAVAATGLPALADDSGIEIDGLDGAPGVYTADWAETPKGRDFVQAMTRAWTELKDRGTEEPWTARFCCTLVLVWPDGVEVVVEGHLPGRVTWPMRGVEGHGYDPMFVPDGHDVTLGEMSADQKNQISHRAVALKKLVETCFA